MLWKYYLTGYKLIGIREVIVEFIQVGRTAVNTYLIEIKLDKT